MEFCFFSEDEYLYQSVGCAKIKRQYLHSSTESEIISLDAGLRTDGLLTLDPGYWVVEVMLTTQGIPKPTQVSTRETRALPQSTPRIKQVLDQNVDLTNVDHVPSNAHFSQKKSQLYILEDNEAVIKK